MCLYSHPPPTSDIHPNSHILTPSPPSPPHILTTLTSSHPHPPRILTHTHMYLLRTNIVRMYHECWTPKCNVCTCSNHLNLLAQFHHCTWDDGLFALLLMGQHLVCTHFFCLWSLSHNCRSCFLLLCCRVRCSWGQGLKGKMCGVARGRGVSHTHTSSCRTGRAAPAAQHLHCSVCEHVSCVACATLALTLQWASPRAPQSQKKAPYLE